MLPGQQSIKTIREAQRARTLAGHSTHHHQHQRCGATGKVATAARGASGQVVGPRRPWHADAQLGRLASEDKVPIGAGPGVRCRTRRRGSRTGFVLDGQDIREAVREAKASAQLDPTDEFRSEGDSAMPSAPALTAREVPLENLVVRSRSTSVDED